MPRSFMHGGKLVTERDVKCPECGAPMILRKTERFKWANGLARLFYGCSRYPQCVACHGAHPDGTPLGIPGDGPTKAARIEAHEWLGKVQESRGWRPGKRDSGTYFWLGRKLGIAEEQIRDKCHISMFDVPTCARVVQICKDALERDRLARLIDEATAKL